MNKLKDITRNITDGVHGDCENENSSGYYFISVKDLQPYEINYENARQITYNDFANANKRTKLEKGDVLFANSGDTIGKMLRVKENNVIIGKTTFQKSIAILKPNCEIINDAYFYYLIKFNTSGLRKSAVGSAQKNLLLDTIRRYNIEINHSLLEQNKTVRILELLDSKIELNNHINAELETMAKILYDYWFVQFDFPNAIGKPYKSSGGAMVWNEELKRYVPEGWVVKSLSDVEGNIITGKTPPTSGADNYNGNIPFITIGDVRGNMHIVSTEQTLSEFGANLQANKYIPAGAICVTCIASPGLVGFSTKKSQTNQQLNSIVCEKFENRYYLYFYLIDYFNHATAKTGNTFANMNKGDFSNIKVINPKSDVLVSFSKVLKSSIDKIFTNSKENLKLSELRDWLLPMLMNGQVRVK